MAGIGGDGMASNGRKRQQDVSYRTTYAGLRGVELCSDPSEVSHAHFTMLENMWCDPLSGENALTETFPGYRVFARLGAPILGIYSHKVGDKTYLLVHAGEKLYRFDERERNFPHALASLSPLPVTVAAEEGCAFTFGEMLCLLIGGEYLVINKNGGVRSVIGDGLAYVPTTYYNGVAHEQRNLLSERAIHTFSADGPYEAVVGEEGLLFTVLNEEGKTCSVQIGEKHRGAGKVAVPATVTIGGDTYTVTAVAARGFIGMPALASISLPSTVRVIGARAFYGDTALRTLSLPLGINAIGAEAFYACMSLKRLFLGGEALHTVGAGAFAYCSALGNVRYAGTSAKFLAIDMGENNPFGNGGITVEYENGTPFEDHTAFYRYPIKERCTEVLSATLGNLPLEENFIPQEEGFVRYQPQREGEDIIAVELTVSDADFVFGKKISFTLALAPTEFSLPNLAEGGISGQAAVCGCRAVAQYDGRCFFTGNALLPNTVFYSALDNTGVSNPFYIGCLNYFNDGMGSIPNRGFLVTGGLLCVLKGDEGGEGTAFFHTPRDTGEHLLPRIYPLASSAPGVGLLGDVAYFAEEAVFLSRGGLFALEGYTGAEEERHLSPRATAVATRLCKEDLAKAKMAVFEGLLYLLCNGNIYLADSRRRTRYAAGAYEYEWYLLTGIGSHPGDTPVYRYATPLPYGAEALQVRVHPDIGAPTSGEVYSVATEEGEQLYYVKNEAGRFLVDCDGEREGGLFYPATCLHATDKALYFGTEEGAIGCFNTDKRGQHLYRPATSLFYILGENGQYLPLNAPIHYFVSEDAVEERALYQRYGDRYVLVHRAPTFRDGELAVLAYPTEETLPPNGIHRYYYSYDGHAYSSLCATAMDDGGTIGCAKETLPHTAAVKLRAREGSRVSLYVRTDRHPFLLCEHISVSAADAGDSDFGAFDFHSEDFAIFPLRERERGWSYKQYLFKSEGHRAPFGIFSFSYAFRPAGRIKP